jgi:hypothetical protein
VGYEARRCFLFGNVWFQVGPFVAKFIVGAAIFLTFLPAILFIDCPAPESYHNFNALLCNSMIALGDFIKSLGPFRAQVLQLCKKTSAFALLQMAVMGALRLAGWDPLKPTNPFLQSSGLISLDRKSLFV